MNSLFGRHRTLTGLSARRQRASVDFECCVNTKTPDYFARKTEPAEGAVKWPEWGAKPEATDLELELPLSAATGRSTAATNSNAHATETDLLRSQNLRSDRN